MLLINVYNYRGIYGDDLWSLCLTKLKHYRTHRPDLIWLSFLIWSSIIHKYVSLSETNNAHNIIIVQHDALLTTCELALASRPSRSHAPAQTPSVLVFYTHHRPHLAHRDMEFFSKACARGWHCEEILTRKFTVSPPFERFMFYQIHLNLIANVSWRSRRRSCQINCSWLEALSSGRISTITYIYCEYDT